MISNANFYWILYHNLLKPVDVQCWYYYPFGTTQFLSIDEFARERYRKKPLALFHFDQEPIWSDDFGHRFDREMFWHSLTAKLPKFLANSEHSLIKTRCCQERNMMDWYYFYHGFAALDWYRDSRYVDGTTDFSWIFSSLNHLARHKRAYRLSLTAKLIDRDLIKHGEVSLGVDATACSQEILDRFTPLSCQEKQLVNRVLCQKTPLPLRIAGDVVNADSSAHFGHREFSLWQRSFLHLVNETVYYDEKLHLTEKTFKPIVALRPFVLVAAPGNLEYLRSYGFHTFGKWWDESYDQISNANDRLDAIVDIVQDLCARPIDSIRSMFKDMQSVLIHNKQHFFGDFRRAIADELVDNFDTCIRKWNNGRVDGRHLPAHPDLASVKQLLSN